MDDTNPPSMDGFIAVHDQMQRLGKELNLEIDLSDAVQDHEMAMVRQSVAVGPTLRPGEAEDAEGKPEETNKVPEYKKRYRKHRVMTTDTMLLTDNSGKYEFFSISFDVYSPEERATLAVREITESKLYENGVPQDNAPMSFYLGSNRASHYCKTCNNRGGVTGQCTGHYGLIKFPEPVYHPMFFKDWTTKFLKMVCFFCGHPTRDWTRVTAKTPKRAIAQYLDLPDGGPQGLTCCPNCEARCRPNYVTSDQSINIQWPPKTKFDSKEEEKFAREEFTCRRAHQILEGMPQWFWQDVLKLQSHPKDICILTSMLVPPTCIRPSVTKRNSTGEMDLTKMLCDIVKHSNQLRAQPSKTGYARLQQAVNMYHDKDLNKPKHMQRSVGPMKARKGIIPSLAGKAGMFRKTLMGKRLNSCSRCVITPDPTVDIDKVRVPLDVAMKLTLAIIVNTLNRRELEECIRRGTNRPGGAHYITFTDGSTVNLRGSNEQSTEDILERLHVGCIVHRMLKTGDPILFNRQPTLSKTSIMAFDAEVDKVYGFNTLRFNPIVCKPFNADFDGDEMTIYIAQSLSARSELRNIVHLRKNIMSGADNCPILGCAQDAMSGLYKLTHENTMLPLEVFMDLAMQQKYPKQSVTDMLEGIYARSIQELVDSGMEVDAAVQQTTKDRSKLRIPGRRVVDLMLPPDCCYYHDGVVVHQGKISEDSEAFTSSHAGSGANSIVAALCLDYDQGLAVEFLSDISRVTHLFLQQYSGFSISMSDLHIPEKARKELDRELDFWVEESRGADPNDNVEMTKPLSFALDSGTEAVRSSRFMRLDSGLGVMIRCGAKGSSLNARQMVACVGQQIIGSSRPKLYRGRTLSCFPKDKFVTDPQARGFARNSYKVGLTAVEFFFHALAGRVGLLETACTTAVSGYLFRRSSKWVENTLVVNDGSIRARHQILCFHSMDGFSPDFLERYRAKDLFVPTDDLVIEPLRQQLAEIRRMQTIEPDNCLLIPMNMEKYLLRYRAEGQKDSFKPVTVAQVDACLQRVWNKYGHLEMTMQKYHSHWVLRQKRSLLSVQRLSKLCDVLEGRIVRSLMQSGTPVGPNSAQSISKDTTQKTLNSFHSTGDELKTGTSRVKELIEHVPSLCYVIAQTRSSAIARSKTAMQHIAESLRPVYLKDVTSSCAVVEQIEPSALARSVLGDMAFGHTLFDKSKKKQRKKRKKKTKKGDEGKKRSLVRQRDRLLKDLESIQDRLQELDESDAEAEELEEQLNATEDKLAKVKESIDDLDKDGEEEELEELHAVFKLDRVKMAEKKLTMLNLYRFVKAQVSVPVTMTSLRADGGPEIRLHFGRDFDRPNAATAMRNAGQILLRGWAEVKDVIVNPRPVAGPEDEGCLDIHCLCTNLSPFYLSHSSLFKLDNLRCNNVTVMCETFGIESALHSLFCELKMCICGDGHVNNHHLWLFALHICNTGKLLAITRHGMSKSGSDCLQRASFEQPSKVLQEACLFGEQSKNVRRCVSSSTIIGSVPGIGTGSTFVYSAPGKKKRRVKVVKQRRKRLETGKKGEKADNKAKDKAKGGQFAECRREKRQEKQLLQVWDCRKPMAEYLRDFYVLAATFNEFKREKAREERRRKKLQEEEEKRQRALREAEEEEAKRLQPASEEQDIAQPKRKRKDDEDNVQETGEESEIDLLSVTASAITDDDLTYAGNDFVFGQ